MATSTSPAGMAQTMLNTVVLVFTLIAGLIVFLRLFTRGFLLRKLGAEDAWISFAMILSIGLTVTIAIQIQTGLGRHIVDITPAQMMITLKAFWASVWMYNLALAVTKLSILTQYLRVFPIRRFRQATFIVMGTVVLHGLWTFFGSIFLCYPVEFFWDKSIPGGKCLNQEAVWFSNSSINIAQDVIMLVLPMTVLRSLDIPRRQKRALIIVFGIGGVVCLVSIIRLQTLVSISNSKDPTFDNPPAAMLSAIETNVGIICGCLPSMRPLLVSILPAYPSQGSQNTWARQNDIEQPFPQRTQSTSSRPYTADSLKKSAHSRSGSGTSRYVLETPKLDRVVSPNMNMFHSRAGSGSGLPTSGNPVDVRYETELQSLGRQRSQSASSGTIPASPGLYFNQRNQHEHNMHPLRQSPFSPPGAHMRLATLPENATYDLEQSNAGPVQRPANTHFHKPLPVTPLPVFNSNPQPTAASLDPTGATPMVYPAAMPAPLRPAARNAS